MKFIITTVLLLIIKINNVKSVINQSCYTRVLSLVSDYFDIVHNPSILDNIKNEIWDENYSQSKEVIENKLKLLTFNNDEINKDFQLLGQSTDDDILLNEIHNIDFLSSKVSSVKLSFTKGKEKYTDILSILQSNNQFKIVQRLRSKMSSKTSSLFPEELNDHDDGIDIQSELLNLAAAYIYANHRSDSELISKIFHSSSNLYSVDPTNNLISCRPLDSYKQMMSSRPSSFDKQVLQYDKIIKCDVTSPTTALLTVQLGLPHVEGRLFRDHLFCAYYDDSWNIVSKTWALNKVENIIL